MSRVALLPSEPIRARMAGIGIRYLEMALRLPAFGVEVVLVTAGDVADAEALLPAKGELEVRSFGRGRLAELLADCDAVVSQGQLANDVVIELDDTPIAVDLYDPFLVENLHYAESLGLDPYRNDHATWVLQLSRGDFFLCSSEEQRQYYLGFLTALGRVNPRRVAADPDLRGLVAPVPFGVPAELKPHEAYLPVSEPGVRRLLFGGLYDWYDPWPVLEAVEGNRQEPWQLLFIHNPNPGTPQKLFGEVEAWCRKRGLWGDRVRCLDWVPSGRRFDLLRDVDLLISTHRPTLETRLSLRTRFLEALAAGCPVITTEGGAVSRMLVEHGAGSVVPEGDSRAVAEAIRRTLAEPEAHRRGAAGLLGSFAWDRVLEPLVEFCRQPRRDPWRHDFAFRPPTLAPADGLAFRLRRKLRHLLVR
ncbi:MAG: glycosyltransferase family 4 protein [Holophagales bacterium]|nr:glycosyltransferase family 4 protein [Holophagales bacterium]